MQKLVNHGYANLGNQSLARADLRDGPGCGSGGGEPAKMAATARFDLTGDAGTGSLENGRVLAGNGTIARMNWVPEVGTAAGLHGQLAGHTTSAGDPLRSNSRPLVPAPSR